MSNASEFLWYIPNEIEGGHRGDVSDADPASLDTLTSHARRWKSMAGRAR